MLEEELLEEKISILSGGFCCRRRYNAGYLALECQCTSCHAEKGQQASSGGGNGDVIIVASRVRGVPREGVLERAREGYKHGISISGSYR